MTITDKGTIEIDFDNNNQPIIIFKPVNGEVWIEKSELAGLFGVYIQTINACIEKVYKSGNYRPEDTSEYNLYTSGNKIKYDMRRFNLQIIIALAFHLNSWQAKLIREWVMGMILRGNSVISYPILDSNQNFRLN